MTESVLEDVKAWHDRWQNVIPFFSYPEPIRKVIYTTNAIESLNAQLRKVTKKRGAFPTEDSVRKVLYLAIMRASKQWTMPIRDWPSALNYFSIVFEGRVPVGRIRRRRVVLISRTSWVGSLA